MVQSSEMLKLIRHLRYKKPRHDLFDAGEEVRFSQKRGRQTMKRIQKKGRG